jgi:hypothetical protein
VQVGSQLSKNKSAEFCFRLLAYILPLAVFLCFREPNGRFPLLQRKATEMPLPLLLLGAAACKVGASAAVAKAGAAAGAKCSSAAASGKSVGEKLFHATDTVHELSELADSGSDRKRR